MLAAKVFDFAWQAPLWWPLLGAVAGALLAWLAHEAWFSDHLFYAADKDYEYRFQECEEIALSVENGRLLASEKLPVGETLVLEIKVRGDWRSRFFDQGNFGAQVAIRLAKFFNRATLLTLDQHLDGTVWKFQQLQNSGDSAHAIKCVGSGIIVSRIFLSQQQDLLVARHRSLEGLDRLLASHEQWDHHVRIHNDITQRQERQFDGCLHDFASMTVEK